MLYNIKILKCILGIILSNHYSEIIYAKLYRTKKEAERKASAKHIEIILYGTC